MAKFLRFLSPKQRPAAEPAISQAAKPLAPAAPASLLLTDVLGEAAASPAAARTKEDESGTSLLSQRLSVGARLAEAKRRTIEAASRLITLSDVETAAELKLLMEDLETRVCCIAFAGQVKAGKSSLINVLVEKPDLLPADINPWTTVITRLHFGVPGKPPSGAGFTFFTQDEWHRLSIGGRTRELTGRLFPDYDWKALSSHVEAMQQRAIGKLGARFEDLLGTVHTYPDITPGLLNRYVGAGHPAVEYSGAGTEGEYAEVTKTADVFFELGAFSFPTILIDTPGVNDPFLVRDEVTRQNLESADICVIVLTARQPLSSSDVSLLRMLRGLNKDRLIIFINKIDEISGGEDVLPEVSRNVRATLKQEFPSADIPIVFGSSIWAREALLSEEQRELAAAGQSDKATPVAGWPSQEEIAETVTAGALFLKSGLSNLAVAISELMQAGPIADSIGATASLLEAVSRNLISWLEKETAILAKIPAGIASAERDLEALGEIREKLAAEFDAFSERLGPVLAQKVSGLHQDAAEAVRTSVAGSGAALPSEEFATRAAQLDAKLRLKLESIFQAALEDGSNVIAGEQERLGTGLAAVFAESSLGEKAAIISGRPLGTLPSPSALSEPAALGLTGSLREFGLRPIPEQDSYLASAMIADFEPIIEKLAGEAARVLKDQTDDLEKQARVLTLSPISVAIQCIASGIEEAKKAEASGSSAKTSIDQQVQAIRETISALRLTLPAEETSLRGEVSAN